MSTADEEDVTAQPLFDGTFSTDAVAAAGHALVDHLHQEAMATIAALAENWDQPEQPPAAEADDGPTTWSDPETWSVEDEEDDADAVRLLPRRELPSLLPRQRPTAAVLSLVGWQPSDEAASPVADAATDELAVQPAEAPEPIAV
jgi:hypothetical protein